MECVAEHGVECPLDVSDYAKSGSCNTEAIDVIAKALYKYWTGNHDCDDCEILKRRDSLDIVKALHGNNFTIVKVVKGGK